MVEGPGTPSDRGTPGGRRPAGPEPTTARSTTRSDRILAAPPVLDFIDFTGKTVLVTGGTRGVGRGIARAFLDAGAGVAVCGRHEPDPEELPRSKHSTTALFVRADLRDPEQAAAAVDTAAAELGSIDVLVNNAGGSPPRAAAESSPRFVSAVVELNLLAPFWCAQAANAIMQRQSQGGSIVNIGSVSGQRQSPGTAIYGAAKAGLSNLTKSLAVEWAPKVRVNCVVAGLLGTEAAEEHYGGAERIRAVAASVPLGRLGTPADVAAMCLFLASPFAGYVTGADFVLHGGDGRPAFMLAVEGDGK
ncbi:MAG: SDR family oxidoreductase [Acidimicrobiales bacterium]